MNITITGPRSVGKSTVSKLLAKKLKLKYISADEIGNKAFKKYGGITGAVKAGIIRGVIKKEGYSLIKKIYLTQKNYVFDLSGGSFTYRKIPKISEEVRKIAKKNSFVVGLLPCRNHIRAVNFLYKREKKREHFKDMNRFLLIRKTIKSYSRFPKILKKNTNLLIYTKNKNPNEIVEEIIEEIN